MNQQHILALDQGTTSSRTLAYDLAGTVVAQAACNYSITYPHPGWVEQDALEILNSQLQSLREVLKVIDPSSVRAIGITNQRETIIAWDKTTGSPLAPAIVWQCRRTADYCFALSQTKYDSVIRQKTGLIPDAYFSASKINWLLKHNANVRAKYLKNEVVFGTVDSWLIYNLSKLSGKAVFATDASNASRTMLYNLHTGTWDQELLDLFEINAAALCEIKPSNSKFARVTILGLDAEICGVLGDQQSSLLGHNCTEEHSLKCTFGTGAFLLKNTGQQICHSKSGLLSTVAWQLQTSGKVQTSYALEGSIFIAGSLIKWLRDQLGLIQNNQEIETFAQEVGSSDGVVIVPAFVGLGSPYWDSTARGTIFGLTAGSTRKHLVYAALEAVAHQVADLLELEEIKDTTTFSIDGGMTVNQTFNQILANILNRNVTLAKTSETTAFGAFCMAGFGADLLNPFSRSNSEMKCYKPALTHSRREDQRAQWRKAIQRTRNWL